MSSEPLEPNQDVIILALATVWDGLSTRLS